MHMKQAAGKYVHMMESTVSARRQVSGVSKKEQGINILYATRLDKKKKKSSILIIDGCAGETKVQGTLQSQVLFQQFFPKHTFMELHKWINSRVRGLMGGTKGCVSSKQWTACSLLLWKRAVQFLLYYWDEWGKKEMKLPGPGHVITPPSSLPALYADQ